MSGALETNMAVTSSTPDSQSGPTVQFPAQDRPITLEVVTLVPPPKELLEAEVPLWNVLEERSREHRTQLNSAKETLIQEHKEPLGRG